MKHFYLALVLLFLYNCKQHVEVKPTTLITASIKSIPKIKVKGEALPFDSMLVVNSNNERLIRFYRAAGFSTVWQSKRARKAMLVAIKKAAVDGLWPDDYQINLLDSLENKQEILDEKKMINYDILLTLNTQLFLSHLKNGKLNPKKMYPNWDVGKPDFNVNKLLSEAFEKNDFDELVQKCRPNAAVYDQLITALQLIQQYDETNFSPIPYTKNIVLNEEAIEMKTIKKRLRYWGDAKKKDSLTPLYDVKTMAAVKRFQARHGLVQDGIIGQATIEALNFSRALREKQIIANLERWRWFEEQNDQDAVFINIPDYKLIVVENKDTTLTHKIVVGTAKRKTPVLNSYLSTIVLNPTWTIPPTILKEDVVPAMLKNRNYLANKKIVIYNSANEVVLPQEWNASKPNAYRYVQAPGPDNTLGEMKIMFPNRHSIYLHDTNHRNVFGLSNRSLSSGCIRVEKPLDVAGYFLSHSEQWSKEKMDSVVATRKTHYVKIKKKYQLYIWYWTAWSDKGKLHFRNDCYDYDLALYDSLRPK